MASAKEESRHYSHLDRDGVLRAVAGALFGALPLLYTSEMWWYGRTVSDEFLLALFLPTVGIVMLCLLFGGFRMGRSERLLLDTLITLGIGIAISAITLLIVGQLAPGIVPFPVALRMIAIEAIPCSIGAWEISRRMSRRFSPQSLVRCSSDSTSLPPKIVFLAEFAERGGGGRAGVLDNPLTETLVSYLLSLGVSLGFLVAFGHVDGDTPVYYVITATVMMSYVTTIGGSAGRVLVVE